MTVLVSRALSLREQNQSEGDGGNWTALQPGADSVSNAIHVQNLIIVIVLLVWGVFYVCTALWTAYQGHLLDLKTKEAVNGLYHILCKYDAFKDSLGHIPELIDFDGEFQQFNIYLGRKGRNEPHIRVTACHDHIQVVVNGTYGLFDVLEEFAWDDTHEILNMLHELKREYYENENVEEDDEYYTEDDDEE